MSGIRIGTVMAVMRVHHVGLQEAMSFLNAPGDQPYQFSTGEVYIRRKSDGSPL